MKLPSCRDKLENQFHSIFENFLLFSNLKSLIRFKGIKTFSGVISHSSWELLHKKYFCLRGIFFLSKLGKSRIFEITKKKGKMIFISVVSE